MSLIHSVVSRCCNVRNAINAGKENKFLWLRPHVDDQVPGVMFLFLISYICGISAALRRLNYQIRCVNLGIGHPSQVLTAPSQDDAC